jgi:hypothetical protein
MVDSERGFKDICQGTPPSKEMLLAESIQNSLDESAGYDDASDDMDIMEQDEITQSPSHLEGALLEGDPIGGGGVGASENRKARRAIRKENPLKRYKDRVAKRSASPNLEENSKAPTQVENSSELLVATLLPPQSVASQPVNNIVVHANNNQPPADNVVNVNVAAPQPAQVIVPQPIINVNAGPTAPVAPVAPPIVPPKHPAFSTFKGKYHTIETIVYVKDFVVPDLTLFEMCADTFLRWTIYLKNKNTPLGDASLLRELNTRQNDTYTACGILHYLLPVLTLERNKIVDLINGMYNSTLECEIFSYLRDFLLESVVPLSVGSMKGNPNLWLPAKIIDIMVQNNLQSFFDLEHYQNTYNTILFVMNVLSIRNSVLSMAIPINSVSVSVLSKAKDGMDFQT